jgi:hypothetical protein
MDRRPVNDGLVLIGALAGAVVGHLLLLWIASQGFYALVLPGGLAGLAAGIGRASSCAAALACGAIGLVAGLFTEWRFAPFAADPEIGYFLTHLHQLRPLTQALIAVGTAIAVWVPLRRRTVID